MSDRHGRQRLLSERRSATFGGALSTFPARPCVLSLLFELEHHLFISLLLGALRRCSFYLNFSKTKRARNAGAPCQVYCAVELWIWIRLAFACAFALLGRVTLRTPFLNSAVTLSASTSSGSGVRSGHNTARWIGAPCHRPRTSFRFTMKREERASLLVAIHAWDLMSVAAPRDQVSHVHDHVLRWATWVLRRRTRWAEHALHCSRPIGHPARIWMGEWSKRRSRVEPPTRLKIAVLSSSRAGRHWNAIRPLKTRCFPHHFPRVSVWGADVRRHDKRFSGRQANA